MKYVYVVIVYRWGNKNNHNYLVGTFSNEEQAVSAMEWEQSFRGGKYLGEITRCPLDLYHPEKDDCEIVRKIDHDYYPKRY